MCKIDALDWVSVAALQWCGDGAASASHVRVLDEKLMKLPIDITCPFTCHEIVKENSEEVEVSPIRTFSAPGMSLGSIRPS